MRKISLLLFFFTNMQLGFACRCASNSLKIEIDQSTEIFKGIAIAKEKVINGYEYTFEISRSWKGNTGDIMKISTGFGGGDCGIQFSLNNEYLIFSNNGTTNRCRRNSLAMETTDILKLMYHFNEDLRNKSFQSDEYELNPNESKYLNKQFENKKWSYDFTSKSVAFTQDRRFVSKSEWYSSNWEHQLPMVQLVVLNTEEKDQADIDAILVTWTWTKKEITARQCKKLIKKLKRKTE